MSTSSTFGHDPSIVVHCGFSIERNSFFASVTTNTSRGAGVLIAEAGFDDRIEHLSDLVDFLGPYATLNAVELRQLDCERRRANALAALGR